MFDEYEDEELDLDALEDDWDVDEIEMVEDEFNIEDARELEAEVEHETVESLYEWYVKYMNS